MYLIIIVFTNNYMIDNNLYSFINNEGIIDIKRSNEKGKFVFHYDETNKIITQINEIELSYGLLYSPSNIQIYYCENEICSRKSGYLKYNNYISLNCSENNCEKIENAINCNESSNTGVAFYDIDSKFKICINIGDEINDKYIAKEINNTFKNYIFSLKKSGESLYNIYTTDLNGYMISSYKTGQYINIYNE